MKFTEPFSHKCPNCSCDVYKELRDKIFYSAFLGRAFICPMCKSQIHWKENCCYTGFRYGLLILLLCVLAGIAFQAKIGAINVASVTLIGVAAIFGVWFVISAFCLELEM